jgi:hypothetical protein
MTKLIAAVIIIAVLYGGWEFFLYWERVKNEEESEKKQAAAQLVPQSLPGMPYQLEPTLDAAQKRGASGLKEWLKVYGPKIEDPRKAWIQLDYVELVSREDPAEARRLFADVKNRTPKTSPIVPRIKKLEKTYD